MPHKKRRGLHDEPLEAGFVAKVSPVSKKPDRTVRVSAQS
jgi:hypothetical protein